MFYVFDMTSTEKIAEQLDFRDGEEVLVTHSDNGRRVWIHDAEAFSLSTFHDDHIEFRRLDDDGSPFEATQDIKRVYQEPHFRTLGSIAYSRAILPTHGEWEWTGASVPLPSALEDFRNSELLVVGANDFTFEIRKGDGMDGEFRLKTIMQALVDRKFLVGSDPGYFAHDMGDHSIGMASIDNACMESLRSFATISLELREQSVIRSRRLARSIARQLDYYSFYRYFTSNMAVKKFDPLLTGILQPTARDDRPILGHMKSILRQNGYEVTKGSLVLRSPEMIDYYKNSLKILDAVKTK